MFSNLISENSIFNCKFRYQLLAALTVQILTVSHGITLGWLSPTVLLLQSPKTPLDFIVNIEEASWIGGFYGIGSLMGNIITGLIIDRVGRKWCLILIAVPHMSMWILIYFAQSVPFLYLARLFGGITGGANYILAPIYISEIADCTIRGGLTSMTMMFMYVGILLGFVLGSYLDYFITPCAVIVMPIVYIVCICMLKETPQFSLRKGNLKQAEISYAFYKNLNANALTANEKNAMWQEFDNLKSVTLKGGEVIKPALRDFFTKDALLALTTCIITVALNQFCGILAFISYMSLIFEASDASLDANLCTIITGVVQIFGVLFTVSIVDRFGRRLLMLVSTSGMIIGLIVYGLYIQLTTAEIKAQFSWLPLVLIIFIQCIGSIGITSLLSMLIVELLPKKIRSAGTSFCMGLLSVLVFVTLKIFPVMLNSLGISYTFYCCAGFCVFSLIYLAILLPETKGKQMDYH